MKNLALLAGISLWLCPATAFAQDSVFLEELTWTEVRDLIDSGMNLISGDTPRSPVPNSTPPSCVTCARVN